MSKDLIEAGTLLADTLEAENAVLAVLDLARAAGMLAGKQHAVAGFTVAQGALPDAGAERMVRRLQALAAENKRLLERAIAAQGRVIGVVARAAAAIEAPPGYGASRGLRPAAFAVAERV